MAESGRIDRLAGDLGAFLVEVHQTGVQLVRALGRLETLLGPLGELAVLTGLTVAARRAAALRHPNPTKCVLTAGLTATLLGLGATGRLLLPAG